MSRHFSNFADAYFDYHRDGYVPDKFHFWAALSVIAAALERKVWLPWGGKFITYPNMYVLLIAQPGVGKSTALVKAREMLQSLKSPGVHIASEQATAAAFIEEMRKQKTFEGGGKIHMHSSAYLSFSEASNSALQNIYGDYVACLTDFYDCPPIWKKSTISKGEVKLNNICVNLLAGSTFDYLSKLVTKENIMGGFASRLFYVAQNEKIDRQAKFEGGLLGQAETTIDETKIKLMEDLDHIHKLQGPFRAEEGFGEMWEAWFNENDKERQSLPSEVMQSILARKNINTLKVCMLLAAAEDSERIIRIRHWDRALALTDEVDRAVMQTFMKSKALNTESQSGINALIMQEVASGRSTKKGIMQKIMLSGVKPTDGEATFMKMLNEGIVVVRPSGYLELSINPDHYL